MDITRYSINSDRFNGRMRIALVADLHGVDFNAVISACRDMSPDCIAVAGDLTDDLASSEPDIVAINESGFEFLHQATAVAPVFYSFGNHERNCTDEGIDAVKRTGATLLNDSYIYFGGMYIGGLMSGFIGANKRHAYFTPPPNVEWLDTFAALDRFKLLICHHPEYYPKFIRPRDIDLTLSGHAHGGQIRLGRQGIYASGQGLFPKYTAGLVDGRLIISRGLANHTPVPRLFNPAELVFVDINFDR